MDEASRLYVRSFKQRKNNCFCDKRELILIKRSEVTLKSLKKFLAEGKRLADQLK